MIEPERIQALNSREIQRGRFVLYWMQASQRAECNHALEYGVLRANELNQPLVVLFGLTSRFPEANERHYVFMLEGLREAGEALRRRGIAFVVRQASPPDAVRALAADASLVVTDAGYLRIQEQWRAEAARALRCPLIQVETDVVVPVRTASQKEEYAAATFRPRIARRLDHFLRPVETTAPKHPSLHLQLTGVDLSRPKDLAAQLPIDHTVKASPLFRGGAAQARARLEMFVAEKLNHYASDHSDPGRDCVSHLSPYLHFGQISPIEIALAVRAARRRSRASREAYLEELIVRRELAVNFCYYNPQYDTFEALPDWARDTLDRHRADPRPYVYSVDQFENAQTHDPYWNAAQRELLLTGKMHNYMRMYWGKKILEWSVSPEEAFRTALYLNNQYQLDGRDPNSFAGVAWCFGKHDRPWAERPVFGTVRYMNAAGLKRKFNMAAYLRKIAELEKEYRC